MGKNVCFVGLDYHKNSVQVCAIDTNERTLVNRKVANDWQAISEAVASASPDGWGAQAAIEACSGAANLAEELATLGGWSVDLAHPGYVARMKQSPDKTDFSDARLLADLERVGYVPRVWQAPHYIVELRRLVQHRRVLANERRNLKLRIGALLRDQRVLQAPAKPWTVAWRKWLEVDAPVSEESRWIIDHKLRQFDFTLKEIRLTEKHLTDYTRDDPVVARLLEEPGIGLVTAWVLRAHIGRFDRFRSGKQLARFCGTSPRNASSGQRQSTSGLIGACDRYLRATLIEAGHRLKRYHGRWRALSHSLAERGKPNCVIVAAVTNRWLRGLYHQIKPLGMGC